MASLYDFSAERLDGRRESLERYRGDVLLIVNTASHCGFTPQYAGLEALHRAHALRRFNVLGFPCNQFANQEPGDAAAIDAFCQRAYGVSFPMFAKVNVNGRDAHPLFKYLKSERPGILWLEAIKWNFTKFLVDRDGKVLERFGPKTKPEAIEDRIAALL